MPGAYMQNFYHTVFSTKHHQKEHQQRQDYKAEFLELLGRRGIEFDPDVVFR